ncbi:MAG TPA: hypothetical protein VMI32_20685 [Candidatus Solibacter sp.]|nr:hypothetical protein [Candidatus Solibacter sp.]
MTDHELSKEAKDLLKLAIPAAKDTDLRRDLWPQMLRKLDEHPAPARSVPWFDWALAALACAAVLYFPGIIPALLYHL